MYLLVIIHHFCDQIPKRNNLKEEGFIVACGFRGFSPCWLTPFFLGYGEAEHHDGRARGSRDVHFMAARKQRQEGAKQELSFKDSAPVTYLPTRPTFHISTAS
jgi:hypothetical protein